MKAISCPKTHPRHLPSTFELIQQFNTTWLCARLIAILAILTPHTHTPVQKIYHTHAKFGTRPQQLGGELKSKVTHVGHCTCWLPSSPSPFFPLVMPSAAPVHPGDYWGPGKRKMNYFSDTVPQMCTCHHSLTYTPWWACIIFKSPQREQDSINHRGKTEGGADTYADRKLKMER